MLFLVGLPERGDDRAQRRDVIRRGGPVWLAFGQRPVRSLCVSPFGGWASRHAAPDNSSEGNTVSASRTIAMAAATGLAAIGLATSAGSLAQADVDPCNWPVNGAVILGDGFPNVLVGTPDNDVIDGRGDNDIIFGGGGDDIILGGAGNDTITGGDGSDTIVGEAGDDTLSGNLCDDEVRGNDGADTVNGNMDDDELHGGDGVDSLDGGPGWDVGDGGLPNPAVAGDSCVNLEVISNCP